MTTKKTPTKQNKREAKAAEKAKAKKEVAKKSTSKGKCPRLIASAVQIHSQFGPFRWVWYLNLKAHLSVRHPQLNNL